MANRFGDQEVNRFGDMAAPPPPAPPPERSPVGKTAQAFWEGIGGQALMDLMAGASRTKEGAERTKAAIRGLAQGIAAEPGRVWGELVRTGKAMVDRDPSGAAYHLAGAVPFVGAPAQQVALDLDRGDPATALGHAIALETPFAAKPVARALAPRVLPAVEATGAGVRTAAEATGAGARAAAPDLAKGAAKVAVGYALEQMLPGAGPLKYALEAPSVYSGAKQIGRGLKKGVKAGREALKARAAAAAEALETESAAATAPAVEVIPPERQLGPGPVITPPPADTSFVRSVPAQVAEVLPEGPLRDRPGASGAALALREAMGLGPDEFRPPAVEAPDFAAAARSGQIDRMAQKLREAGIDARQAMLLDPPDLAMLAKAAGIEGEPLGVTGRDLVVRLKELEKPKRAPAPRKPAAPAAVAAPAPAAPAMTPAEAEAALAKEYPRPAAVETAPVPTAAEARIEKIAQTLSKGDISTADLAGIEALPDGALWIEKLSRSLNLARPGAGEIAKIVERVREIRGEPLQTVQKGAGEAAFQEQRRKPAQSAK